MTINEEMRKAIWRTRKMAEMDKNAVRRAAKLDALQLVETDINATLRHLQASAPRRVVVQVRGGNVVDITQDDGAGELGVVVVDWDNLNAGDEFNDTPEYPKTITAAQLDTLLQAYSQGKDE